MLIALIGAPAIPLVWFAAFLLFRFFDIVKPFPVNWLDKHLNGGLGIVLDDIFAGLYTLLVLQAGYMLIGI
ncbi:MAG: phosphatidylglycerophosphatase A [Deltaproteobacteria bacterium]|nr:phosphatidylglycerophosphatase A [Deltaproteobacteria bacterium]